MLTFLSDEYRKKALKEYHLRLWSLYLGLFVLILATGATLAVPQFLILGSKRHAAMIEKTATSADSKESGLVVSEVKAMKEKIALIRDNSAKEPIMSVLERVLTKKGEGIAISSITLSRGGKPGAIAISGMAATRDALVAFSKRLQSEPLFSNANIPVSSLAKNKDIPFSISIDSKF